MPVHTTGRAGGPGDGRGIEESSGGSSMMATKAIEVMLAKTGRPVPAAEGTDLSLREALAGNRFTDPKRD